MPIDNILGTVYNELTRLIQNNTPKQHSKGTDTTPISSKSLELQNHILVRD